MGFNFVVGAVTGAFGLLSFIGSTLILASYYVTVSRTGTTPKSARLVFYLSCSDLLWFLTAVILGTFWMAHTAVPRDLCFIIAPVLTSTRISSLLWTSVIAFDVLQSVKRRKWRWKGTQKWELQYFVFVYALSLPSAVMSLNKQARHKEAYGCAIAYEPLGPEWAILIFEVFPLLLGFVVNVAVYMLLRSTMSSAFPQSVRERRRQMLYQYVLVGIVCWLPTMIHYILTVSPNVGDLTFVTLFARATLYSSGFLNFLVYGLQDRYLRQAFADICCCITEKPGGIPHKEEKTVMFNEDTLLPGANITKSKKDIYYFNRLSPDDKEYLYQQRPDLNMNMDTPLLEDQDVENEEDARGSGGSDNDERLSEADRVPSKRRNTGLLSELLGADENDSSESDSEEVVRQVNFAGSTPPALGGQYEDDEDEDDFSSNGGPASIQEEPKMREVNLSGSVTNSSSNNNNEVSRIDVNPSSSAPRSSEDPEQFA